MFRTNSGLVRKTRMAKEALADTRSSSWPTIADPEALMARGYPRRCASNISDNALIILDVVLTARGHIVLRQIHGAEAGLTSVAFGHDGPRANHMATMLDLRKRKLPVVVLLSTPTRIWRQNEFDRCIKLLSREIIRRWGVEVRVRSFEEALGEEEVCIVIGGGSGIVPHLTHKLDQLLYQGRAVALMGGSALLHSLTASGVTGSASDKTDLNLSKLFSEGPFVHLLDNRLIQQELVRGTGFTPLFHVRTDTLDEAEEQLKTALGRGLPIIVNIQSSREERGGTSREFLACPTSDQVDQLLRHAVHALAQENPPAADDRLHFQLIECATSTDLQTTNGVHQWLLRVCVMTHLDGLDIYPCAICISPAIVQSSIKEERWRTAATLDPDLFEGGQLRSPVDEMVLNAIGLGAGKLDMVLDCCVHWCENAWWVMAGAIGCKEYEHSVDDIYPTYFHREFQ